MAIKFLDGCCGGGAASWGYWQAAKELGLDIEITGVDIAPHKNYPFTFIQADILEYLDQHGHEFDFIHVSPPCQQYSQASAVHRAAGKQYPDLVEPVRSLLLSIGVPAVMENVMQAPLRGDIVLRGDVFGLKVIRKRKFELVNWFSMSPMLPQLRGSVVKGDYVCIFGSACYAKSGSTWADKKKNILPTFKKNTVRETWLYAMGIEHPMTVREIAESIPPAYTKFIGLELFSRYAATPEFYAKARN